MQVNARETALLSAASDSYTTQSFSINNEEERSSTEKKRWRGGGKTRPGGTEWASKGIECSREIKEEWQLKIEI